MTDQSDNSYVEYSFNSDIRQLKYNGPCIQIRFQFDNGIRQQFHINQYQIENEHLSTVTFGEGQQNDQQYQSRDSQIDQPSHYTYAHSSDLDIENSNEYTQSQNIYQQIEIEQQEEHQGLTLQEINQFPQMEWKKTHNYINKGQKCSFCLDEYKIGEILRVVPCMHRFHKNCIDEWLISKSTCPLCKRDFQT